MTAKVGVGHDHHVVLCAAQGLYALAIGRTLCLYVTRQWRRPYKAHCRDQWMRKERIDRDLVALHDVEHAVRKSRILQQFGESSTETDGSARRVSG